MSSKNSLYKNPKKYEKASPESKIISTFQVKVNNLHRAIGKKQLIIRMKNIQILNLSNAMQDLVKAGKVEKSFFSKYLKRKKVILEELENQKRLKEGFTTTKEAGSTPAVSVHNPQTDGRGFGTIQSVMGSERSSSVDYRKEIVREAWAFTPDELGENDISEFANDRIITLTEKRTAEKILEIVENWYDTSIKDPHSNIALMITNGGYINKFDLRDKIKSLLKEKK